MKTIGTRLAGMLMVAAFAALFGADQAQAQHTPKLGIYTQFTGSGEYVTGTAYGSEARRLGIEQGDTIVAINGRRLNYYGAFSDMVRYASNGGGELRSSNTAYHGGHTYLRPVNAYVTLHIRDWRTGRTVTRTTNLANWR